MGDLIDVLGSALDGCRRMLATGLRRARVWEKRNIHGATEQVTDLDLAIEQRLIAQLRASRPGLALVGEESHGGADGFPSDGIFLDPIDGTYAMLAGLPFYSISICEVADHVAQDAVIDLPAFGVRVGCRRGQPPTVAGEIGRLPDFGPSSLLVSPSQIDQIAPQLASGPGAGRLGLAGVARQVHAPVWSAHPMPTASVKILLVALGRATASVSLPAPSRGAAPWDYAGAMLIATESGCFCEDERGVAMNPQGHGVVVGDVLRGWRVTRPGAASRARPWRANAP